METGEAIGNFSETGIREAMVSNSSEAMKIAVSEIMKQLMPFIQIISGLIGLYIIFLIAKAVSGIFFNKRIKRIDRNLQEIHDFLINKRKKK